MIGKVIKGTSFSKCIAYCLGDKKHLSEMQKQEMSKADGLRHLGRAEVLIYNQCGGNDRELAEQFRDVARLSRKVEKPVLHLTLRAAPGDKLSRSQWLDIAQATLKEFGITDRQYLAILHQDTKQPHIHIVANRVGYDGRVIGDSNSYARMAALCRRLEVEQNLTKVLSPRRFLSPAEKLMPRKDQRKTVLRNVVIQALKGTSRFEDFEKTMNAKGYRVEKGRGIAFEDKQNVRTKGSEIGFSLATIERQLAQNRLMNNQERLLSGRSTRNSTIQIQDFLPPKYSQSDHSLIVQIISDLMEPVQSEDLSADNAVKRAIEEQLRRKKGKRRRL